MLLEPVKYPVLAACTYPNRLDILMLVKENIPFTSVDVVAAPLETAAPSTGSPFSSTTLPCKLAVTVTSAGILLGLVVPLLLEMLLLQAMNMITEMTNKVSDRVKRVFFTGYCLG